MLCNTDIWIISYIQTTWWDPKTVLFWVKKSFWIQSLYLHKLDWLPKEHSEGIRIKPVSHGKRSSLPFRSFSWKNSYYHVKASDIQDLIMHDLAWISEEVAWIWSISAMRSQVFLVWYKNIFNNQGCGVSMLFDKNSFISICLVQHSFIIVNPKPCIIQF